MRYDKRDTCAICGKELTWHQNTTCSMKHRRQFMNQENNRRRKEKIIKAMNSLKYWSSKNAIRVEAGNMDIVGFNKTFSIILKEKIVDSMKSSRGMLYQLKDVKHG